MLARRPLARAALYARHAFGVACRHCDGRRQGVELNCLTWRMLKGFVPGAALVALSRTAWAPWHFDGPHIVTRTPLKLPSCVDISSRLPVAAFTVAMKRAYWFVDAHGTRTRASRINIAPFRHSLPINACYPFLYAHYLLPRQSSTPRRTQLPLPFMTEGGTAAEKDMRSIS